MRARTASMTSSGEALRARNSRSSSVAGVKQRSGSRTSGLPGLRARTIRGSPAEAVDRGVDAIMAPDACHPRLPVASMTGAACSLCQVMAALRGAETCVHPTEGEPVRKVADLPASIAVLGFDQTYRGYTLVIA